MNATEGGIDAAFAFTKPEDDVVEISHEIMKQNDAQPHNRADDGTDQDQHNLAVAQPSGRDEAFQPGELPPPYRSGALSLAAGLAVIPSSTAQAAANQRSDRSSCTFALNAAGAPVKPSERTWSSSEEGKVARRRRWPSAS